MKIRVGVIGYSGLIGSVCMDRDIFVPIPVDVTDIDAVATAINSFKGTHVLNLAAIKDVDYCERAEKESMQVNYFGHSYVSMACKLKNTPYVLISTDHVFNGKKLFGGYRETDTPNPVNEYGYQKWGAEILSYEDGHKVIRTSFVFPSTLKELESMRSTYQTTKIRRSFIWVEHFVNLLEVYFYSYRKMPQMLHLSGSETVSWYKFADTAFPGKYKKWNTYRHIEGKADRPVRGGLNVSLARSLGFRIPSYKDGLQCVFQ